MSDTCKTCGVEWAHHVGIMALCSKLTLATEALEAAHAALVCTGPQWQVVELRKVAIARIDKICDGTKCQ